MGGALPVGSSKAGLPDTPGTPANACSPDTADAPASGTSAALAPVVADYLTHLAAERRYSPHTLDAARRDLAVLVAHAAARPLESLTPADLRALVVAQRVRGLAPASLARRLSSWRGFYRYACRRHGWPANPCVGLRPPKAARPLPDTPSVDACAQLLDHAPDGALEIRDRAVAELFYSSGLRLAELARARLADYADGELRVLGKGGKTRVVPVGEAARVALAAWLAERPALARADAPEIFVGQRGEALTPRAIQLRLARWAQVSGMGQHLHPHQLRHACASHLLAASGDLRAVQELLGHASIRSTQIYTRLDWQRLAEVYDAAHPRARKKGG